MFSGRKGWFYIWSMAFFSVALPWGVWAAVTQQLRDVRVAAWSVFGAAAIAGALFQVRLHGPRLKNVALSFSASTRSRHRRNASIGAGVGIFIAALLGGFDSPWLVVVISGFFTGGCPVWAGMSTHLMRKHGHTL